MTQNEELINTFYTCFKNKDFRGMQACYADNAVFNDCVFQNLNAALVKAMWEMFCKNGKDLNIEFSNVTAENNKGGADWVARYTFSATGKKVVNRIKANFIFENGKFQRHYDSFDFHKWASQALGIPGFLLGWTPFVRNKVRKAAMKNLIAFMNKSRLSEISDTKGN
jgi:ketosteroid isomerase-like protein